MGDTKKTFYITTPIYYPSAKLHIGHTYCTSVADTIARFKRLAGYDVRFLTGSDEHGQKIQRAAEAQGITPLEYTTNIVNGFKALWEKMHISNDDFIRTTDPRHEKVVQELFTKAYEKGDIYKAEYEGWYCTPCESFWTEQKLGENHTCPDCGRPVERVKEESYFFKLGKYTDQWLKFIEENPDFIQPESRRNEMIQFVKQGLEDLAVSRTSFDWGIKVPFDPKHVVYVWLDALTNYITNIGYDVNNSNDLFKKLWPADLHLIGKDIIRFHTIYWPCFLWSLGLELPKKVYGHPWLLMNNNKMSKSVGNVIYADDLVEKFGVDAVRYYVLSEISFANDGNITMEMLIDKINSDLANVLGNLVQRTISMGHKYFSGVIINKKLNTSLDEDFISKINKLDDLVSSSMDIYHASDALGYIFDLLRASNKYIDDTTPWVLAKEVESTDRLETVLYNLLESIRVAGVILRPFIPDTSLSISNQINNYDNSTKYLDDNKYNLGEAKALFQRIDKTKFDL